MSDYLIGVQARIEDAGLLADAGRYEGALIMLLVAMSATSRKVYPETKVKSPGKAFKQFVKDCEHHLLGIKKALQAANLKDDLGNYLWKTLRNALEHNGQLSIEHHPVKSNILVTLSGDEDKGIGLTKLMLVALENAIARHEVNSWENVRDEVQNRYPDQNSEPSITIRMSTDQTEQARERLEQIDSFLRWYKSDQIAIDALKSEKKQYEEIIQKCSDNNDKEC